MAVCVPHGWLISAKPVSQCAQTSFSFISIRVEKYMFFSCTGLIEVGVFQGVLSLSESQDLEVKTTFQKGKKFLWDSMVGIQSCHRCFDNVFHNASGRCRNRQDIF